MAALRFAGHLQRPVKGFGLLHAPLASRTKAETKASASASGDVQMPSTSSLRTQPVPSDSMVCDAIALDGRKA